LVFIIGHKKIWLTSQISATLLPMNAPPKCWYEVLATTQDSLPWQVQPDGAMVLGSAFPTAQRNIQPTTVTEGSALPSSLAWSGDKSSPLPTAEQAYGTLVHAALQGLPVQAPEALRNQAETEAAAVRKALPWLWAPGSRAEVALVLANGAIGRADRVVPQGETWWVVDFKTGAPATSIPSAYTNQLQVYAVALAASLPHATLRAAVVWTATATLAEVTLSG
jgi:ATP-dependent exoDNAse (exonuclease V) beta subunit